MSAGRASERGTVAILSAGGMVFAVTQSMVVPLFPAIAADTDGDPAALSWLLTGPLVVAAALSPALGRWADLHGKKPTLLATLAVMAVGGIILSVSTWIPLLIFGRCLQGLGGAFVPVAISLLRDLVPPNRFPRGVGLLSASLGLGIALGVPIAAVIADVADWQTAFAAISVLTAVIVALVVFCVRDGARDQSDGNFDVVGAIALAVILAALMLSITASGELGILDWRVLTAFGFVLVSVVVWGRLQARSRAPVIDLRLAAQMPVAITNAIAFFIGFAMFANILVTTQVVQVPNSVPWGHGLNLSQAGLLIAPAGVAMVVFSPVAAVITASRGAKTAMAIALPVLMIGYVIQIALPGLWGAQIGLIVANIGVGMGYAVLPVLISSEVPANATASANSINVLARTIGHAACSAVNAALLLAFSINLEGTAIPLPEAFTLTFTAAIVACAIALVLTFLLPARGPAATDLPAPQPR